MKKIKIFVAGSKSLVKEREGITLLANGLNSQNEHRYSLTVYTYERFNDNQDEYNEFIQHKADIVIFVLDGYIGEKTREEFMKATEAFNQRRRPKIMIFLKKTDDTTEEIGHIKGLIAGRLGSGKYYADYTNVDELKSKVRERIERYVENPKGGIAAPADGIRGRIGTSLGSGKCGLCNKWVVAGMLCVIVALSGILWWKLFMYGEMIVFAGGGSVRNYIENTRGVDIRDYPNSVYCDIASRSAWSLLTEEAHRYQKDKAHDRNHFLSVCFSADDIDSLSMYEQTKNLFHRSKIVRYLLGWDTLAVFVHDDLYAARNPSRDGIGISVDSLRSLVKYALTVPDDVRIFTTTKSSGTLNAFQSCFEPSDSVDLGAALDAKQALTFYNNTELAYLNSYTEKGNARPYIILCSDHYYPDFLASEKNRNYKKLYVMNGTEAIKKPMNVYFLAHYDANDSNYFTIDNSIVKFMKALNAEKDIDPETWENLIHGKIKVKDDRKICNLN